MKSAVKTPDLLLYEGAVQLRFTHSGHRYQISTDGGSTWSKKIGVTTVLGATVAKDGLLPWAAGLAAETFLDVLRAHYIDGGSWDDFDTEAALTTAKRAHTVKKEAGADTGTIVHGWIEAHIKSDLMGASNPAMPEDQLAQAAVLGFLRWETETKPQWLAIERPVYSKRYDYCGTFDALAQINGQRVLLDFKTGNAKSHYRSSKFAGITAYPEHFVQVGGYSLAHTEESGRSVDRHAVLYVQKNGQVHYFDSAEVKQNETAFVAALSLYHRLQDLQ